MDDSHHHGDTEYDTSYGVPTLSPSSTLARLSATPADSHHEPDPTFSYGLPTFDTIPPSSLNAFHTSHDDTCVDTCIPKDYSLFPPHRGPYTLSHAHRPRLSTSSIIRPHFQLESNAYTAPIQESDFFSPYFFPDMKYTMGNDPKSSNFFPYSGHQVGGPFDSTVGPDITQQCSVPDDCASVDCSQISCSSNCCSTVCQDKSCTEGTPCNDESCFDNNLHQPFSGLFDEFQDWHHSISQGLADDPHNQPCNHTNAEHDVAFTLRDLKEPGSSNIQQHQDVFQFECPFLGASEQSVDPDRAFSLGHDLADLTYGSTIDPGPSEPKTCAKPPIASAEVTQHICSWFIPSDDAASGEGTVCGRVFSDSSALNEHLCADHISLLSAKTKYICLWKGCPRQDDQGFASRNKLKRHITTHTAYKPFSCEQCGEGFSAQQALDQHRRTHTGEKPYKCPEPGCDKSFKQKSALTMHIRTHTGEKPLKCEICGKCFCESSNLSKHRKTHNPDYKFKCDEPGCDSQFIRIDQLRRHQAKHTRQRKKSKVRSQAGLLTPLDELTPESQYPMTLEGEQLV